MSFNFTKHNNKNSLNLLNFDYVSLKIFSSEKVKEYSRGEVKNSETINYRTFKPEQGGLFCQRIFGPTQDYECSCGKFKRIKYKGVVCDKCGVEVTFSRVRRERMGHIELAVPVAHIWFFKNIPSRVGLILNISIKSLEKIVYYTNYIVINPGKTGLKFKQILTSSQYNELINLNGLKSFVAKTGANALKDLLKVIDFKYIVSKLNKDLKKLTSKQLKIKISKRLRILKSFLKSTNKPEALILENLPVIPPDLRPLVPLEGNKFATSDLNDLYRRVINRNNRLKNLLQLKTPEVIINNECRMLQESVDSLLDNSRRSKPFLTSFNRPLKSLSDMLKGKQGRFRQNLLGKRVDYSGRSVIVVDPELKLHQCGLPIKMALILFEPFIINKLKTKGLVHTVKGAKKMIDQRFKKVIGILHKVIRNHPILLNRAPTLHKLSIQAFEPTLIRGNSIKIHPLVCSSYNADFDGDQMAVHIPLSLESIKECKKLMMSVNNVFLSSNGSPVMSPSQDIVLGIYYLTLNISKTSPKLTLSAEEVLYNSVLNIHSVVLIKNPDLGKRTLYGNSNLEKLLITKGRLLFNCILPKSIGFINSSVTKSKLTVLISHCYSLVGRKKTVIILDILKKLGFRYATRSSSSISIFDMLIPTKKDFILKKNRDKVKSIEFRYKSGLINLPEKHNKVIELWTKITNNFGNLIYANLQKQTTSFNYINPIYLMIQSGARGSKQQVRQLCGIRGLMVKPSGSIIENPILASFREGLSVIEYFNSTHGARKGLADTALKTADAGYLTRKLCDVAMDVLINRYSSKEVGGLGIWKTPIKRNGVEILSLKKRILGRYSSEDILNPHNKSSFIVKKGHLITNNSLKQMGFFGIRRVRVMSPLSSPYTNEINSKEYGLDLSTGQLVKVGSAVGITAAQSIGEPGTQLTMRTFHIGGVSNQNIKTSKVFNKSSGVVIFKNLVFKHIGRGTYTVLNDGGSLEIFNLKNKNSEVYPVYRGYVVKVKSYSFVNTNELLFKWDFKNNSFFSENVGYVSFSNLKVGVNWMSTGSSSSVILNYDAYYLTPCLSIKSLTNNLIIKTYVLNPGSKVYVEEGRLVNKGSLLFKRPVTLFMDKDDITGGLPKIAELFEVRKPKKIAEVSDISGFVELKFFIKKNKTRVVITDPIKKVKSEFLIPSDKNILVNSGDYVNKGFQLTEGGVDVQKMLSLWGVEAVQEYLISEIQKVYLDQSVFINDKHLEIIVSQMFKKVKVINPGDSSFFWGERVDKSLVFKENLNLKRNKRKLIEVEPLLLGITKASLETNSFISAASFQETTKILTDASILGKLDFLKGFKENVILGHLIPAGTGFSLKKKK